MTIEPGAEIPAEGSVKGKPRLASSLIAAGILLSRISGLIRQRIFGQFFGTTLYADVFSAALRMPNALQNLLGEGTLSASFIPVYSELLEEGREEDAGRTAGAVFGLLLVGAGLLSLLGILLAPVLVSLLSPGFEGERRELTIEVVRIIFPMTGLLVLSAWALGILNSHRKFFVPYVAPVLWNGAMISALIFFGGRISLNRLVVALAWGALIGGALQLAIQLPWVLKLEKRLRPSLDHRLASVREAIRNAGPAIAGRGVVQLSGYVDLLLASLLAHGAVAAIGYAQTLYVLPVSLFGMSVAAAELPELARKRLGAVGELRARTNAGLERIAFFVVPSFVAFATLGDAVVGALFQTGEFDRSDTLLVYLTLMGFSIGLVASTGTRLFSSTFYALRDTRTPARFAMVRVTVAASLGFLLMIQFEPIPALGIGAGVLGGLNIDGQALGAVGLATGSGIAAWIEWTLLRRRLRDRIGPVGAQLSTILKMFLAALVAAAAGWGVRLGIGGVGPLIQGVLVFSVYGLIYFLITSMLKLSETEMLRRRVAGLTGRSR
jgi:putative peptidoglycan lipid II flippase